MYVIKKLERRRLEVYYVNGTSCPAKKDVFEKDSRCTLDNLNHFCGSLVVLDV